MTDKIDIAIFQDEFGLFDLRIGDDGDLVATEGFNTTIKISVLSRQRATAVEMPDTIRRDGWWGNIASLISDFENGSKLWLLQQSRLTTETANQAKDFINKATAWLVENGWAVSIETNIKIVNDILDVVVTIFRPNGQVEKVGFELWNNTGQQG